MNFVGMSERNFVGSFLDGSTCHTDNCGSLEKFDLKARPQLFDFILEILSNPCFSSIMTWEGVHGQFVIKRPDTVACLWGNRNGRRNMTYQTFCRALRYYYHKNVLTKIRGRKFTYKFNFRELERQYGFKSIPFPATSAYSDTPSCAIPATGVHATDIFPATEVHTCDMFPATGVHTTAISGHTNDAFPATGVRASSSMMRSMLHESHWMSFGSLPRSNSFSFCF